MMKRRAILLLATMGAALIAASGVALALSCGGGTCEGNPNNNRIHGTDSSDDIFGQVARTPSTATAARTTSGATGTRS